MSLPWPEKLGDVSGTLDNFSTGDADKWSAAPFNEQISDLEDDLLCRHNGINDNVCSKAASDVRLTDEEENNAGNRNLDWNETSFPVLVSSELIEATSPPALKRSKRATVGATSLRSFSFLTASM